MKIQPRSYSHWIRVLFCACVAFILCDVFCGVAQAKSRTAQEIQVAELQFAICGVTPAEIVKKLGAQVVKRELRQTYYLETLHRDLQKQGAIVRFRQTKKGVKSSVKKTFEISGEIPREIFDDFSAGCEVDAYLSRAKIGCSVKNDGTRLGELSQPQKGFLRLSGIEAETWKTAQLIGPVHNESFDLEIQESRFSLDLILIPNGDVLTELSTRVALADAFGLQGRLVEMLRASGLRLCDTQQGVTKKILDHYLGPAT